MGLSEFGKTVGDFMDAAANKATGVYEKVAAPDAGAKFDLRNLFKQTVLNTTTQHGAESKEYNQEYSAIANKLKPYQNDLIAAQSFGDFWNIIINKDTSIVDDFITLHDSDPAINNHSIIPFLIKVLSEQRFLMYNNGLTVNTIKYRISKDEKGKRALFVEDENGKVKYDNSVHKDAYDSNGSLVKGLFELQNGLGGEYTSNNQETPPEVKPEEVAQALVIQSDGALLTQTSPGSQPG